MVIQWWFEPQSYYVLLIPLIVDDFNQGLIYRDIYMGTSDDLSGYIYI